MLTELYTAEDVIKFLMEGGAISISHVDNFYYWQYNPAKQVVHETCCWVYEDEQVADWTEHNYPIDEHLQSRFEYFLSDSHAKWEMLSPDEYESRMRNED